MKIAYFDNNATTRIDDLVLDAMLPYLKEQYGNASSVQHKLGRQGSHAVEHARIQVAELIHANPKEITFTSGSTEAINTVLRGISKSYRTIGNRILTCGTEHKAVLTTCEQLTKEGMAIDLLKVNELGEIDLQALEDAIGPETVLVCLMAANNETGVLHPLQEIAEICQRKGVLFFCDATQWIGKLPLNVEETPIDILCLSAHKMHGPKGIGALYIRRKSKPIQIPALISGGKQEHGLRGGTYPVHQIVGLGEAAQQAQQKFEIATLRDYFEAELLKAVEESSIPTKGANRLPNTSNVLIKHVKTAELMTKLPHVAFSSGSACVSGDRDPSHVLKAMGYSDEDAYCSMRFSFSKYTDREEVDTAIQQLKEAVAAIRAHSPIWEMYKDGLI